MNKIDSVGEVLSQFKQSVDTFCRETDGLACEFEEIKKGKKKTFKALWGKVFYSTFAVTFTYTAHSISGAVNSILECAVCFGKTEDAVTVPLPIVADYCDVDTVTPFCLPFIMTAKGMEQAVNCVGSIVKMLLDRIGVISGNEDEKAKLFSFFRKEASRVYNLKMDYDIDLNADSPDGDVPDDVTQADAEAYVLNVSVLQHERFFDAMTVRCSYMPYLMFLRGQTVRAVKTLKKIRKPFGYEKRLMRLWGSVDCTDKPDLSDIEKSVALFDDIGTPKIGFKELCAFFVSMVLLTVGFTAVYAGLLFLLISLEGLHSVFLLGPSDLFPLCYVFGMLTAICTSYFARSKLYGVLFKKDYEQYREVNLFANTAPSDKVMKVLLCFVAVLCVVCSFVGVRFNVNFRQDGFVDNSSVLAPVGDAYAYGDIEYVYYKATRINGNGDIIDRPSYVLKMKNGKEIDLYQFSETEECETGLIPFLRDRGIKNVKE